MHRVIAYTIACGVSFLTLAAGVFIAFVPHGSLGAGLLLTGLSVAAFAASVTCALRDSAAPGYDWSRLERTYEYTPQLQFQPAPAEAEDQQPPRRRAA